MAVPKRARKYGIAAARQRQLEGGTRYMRTLHSADVSSARHVSTSLSEEPRTSYGGRGWTYVSYPYRNPPPAATIPRTIAVLLL